MKVAIIGAGNVGSALAGNLAKAGHQITFGARNPDSESVKVAMAKHNKLTALTVAEATQPAEIVFLATPFTGAETALESAGDLTGKIVVDCTNPVGQGISHALKDGMSGGETIQRLIPGAKVVKAFSIYGFENFVDSAYPGYGDIKPAMLISGDDNDAKEVVANLCKELGWEAVDCGPISMSLHIEHMALLWIKMARMQGKGAGFVWARLRRQE